jgi:hypothetical protein
MAQRRIPWLPPLEENQAVEMLRQDHREIRSALARAAKERGPIGEAAKTLAGLCFPHFEVEERTLLPILANLHDLASGGDVHPTLTDLQALLAKLSREGRRFEPAHQAIVSVGEVFLEAAYKEGRTEFTALGDLLMNHERNEEEVGFAAYELGFLGNSRI